MSWNFRWLGIGVLAVSMSVAGCGGDGADLSAGGSTPSTGAPVNFDEVVSVDTRSDLAYYQIQDQAEALLKAGKFDEIETLASQYRQSQETIPSGMWKLAGVYLGVAEVDEKASNAEWEKRVEKISQWTKSRPKSVTARVALARCYHDGAYRSRGMGWGSGVKENQWKEMYARLDKGARVLADSTAMRKQCPGWYAAAQRIAALENRPQKEFDAITDEALQLFPAYEDFHFFRAKQLLPRWGGSKDAWQKYAAQVANEKGGEAGDALYARIIWSLQKYAGSETLDELDGFDWPRAKRGFEVIGKGPDPFASANAFARVAWLADDRETASSLFQSPIGTHADFSVWWNREEFKKARRWALQG